MQPDLRRHQSLLEPVVSGVPKRPEQHSVTDLISDTLDDVKPLLVERNIQMDLDLQPIEAVYDRRLIGLVVANLVRNAIDACPSGMELSVTTIDGPHQWELEVADSSEYVDSCQSAIGTLSDDSGNPGLPRVIPFPHTEFLRAAYRAAFAHGCRIQNWRCPLGGMAYVLTVPRHPGGLCPVEAPSQI